MLNDNGIIMSFKSFKLTLGINTVYITHSGYMQAIKSYIHITGFKLDSKNSADIIKTLKTISSQQNGSRLYYEVNMLSINKLTCDKWYHL